MTSWRFDSSLLDSVCRSLGIITDGEEVASHPTTYETLGPDPTDPPPPYEDQEEPPRRVWQIRFEFVPNHKEFKKRGSIHPKRNWWARLEIETWDIAGVMRDGLFLTQDKVQEQEGHATHTYWPEDKTWTYTRSYTINDSRWSGYLHVCSSDIRAVADFRLHYLTANIVSWARVEDEEEFLVYCYDVDKPERSANFIYDDMPLGGVWPWPKEEDVVESHSGGHGM